MRGAGAMFRADRMLKSVVCRFAAPSLLSLLLLLPGCKPRAAAPVENAPTPPPVATPTPLPPPTPTPAPSTSVVTVLGYHRFENPPSDPLAISTKEFEAQMQRIKDGGVTVISMDDFLAWRRGAKSIPPRCAVITIDDGYVSGYTEAWPVLKKFGYPFTMFVYTNYISAGGKSIKWEQLAEMVAAGVDIGSHTVSHADLVRAAKGKTEPEYETWLWNELRGSKDILEQRLNTKVRGLAFPYGVSNALVRQVGMKAGYEALFTVNGIKTLVSSPAADSIGRSIIEYTKPKVFDAAITFGGGALATAPVPAAVASANPAAASMLTQPMEGETVKDPRPLIKANLASLGKIDPKTVEMQLSGFGAVSAQYDPATQLITFQPTQKIREKACTVTVTATAGGKKVATRWTFYVDPE